MPRGRAWTQEETDILIQDRAQGHNCVEIGSKLGKSPNAVRVRSYVMGLGKGTRWSQKEIDMLYTMTNKEISEITGRSERAVMVKRAKVCPVNHASRPWTTKEVQMVMNREMKDKDLATALNRSIAAIWLKRSTEKKRRAICLD